MKQKLIFGLAGAAVLGGVLVACGSGDVSKWGESDEASLVLAEEGYNIADALDACALDPECAKKIDGALPEEKSSSSSSPITEPVSSSAAVAVSSAAVAKSSASISFSSASETSSSSALVAFSSAAIADDGTVNGTCEPKPATIEKGGVTSWTFNKLSPAGMAGMTAQQNAIFDWTMPGSTEATFSGKGSEGGNKVTGTYSASGSFGATLVVDGNTIQCSQLQVNGAPITGCTCTPDLAKVDVVSGSATATWTVTGCVTNATITGYEWKDATGTGESATASFTTKGEKITPTVVVSNDDNTKQEFTCGTVEAMDSSAPEYEISSEKISLPNGACGMVTEAGKVRVTGGWQNSSCTVSVTIGGTVAGTLDDGNCNLSVAGGYPVNVGDQVCVDITGADSIKLSVTTW